jgi:hypothetical protein
MLCILHSVTEAHQSTVMRYVFVLSYLSILYLYHQLASSSIDQEKRTDQDIQSIQDIVGESPVIGAPDWSNKEYTVSLIFVCGIKYTNIYYIGLLLSMFLSSK